MAFLVSCYVGETHREGRPAGFSDYNAAVQYLFEVQKEAINDGFRVSGDPLNRAITLHDPDGNTETYVLSETSDLRQLRKATYH